MDRLGLGMGGIALAKMMSPANLLAASNGGVDKGIINGQFHFPPTAKRVIYLFMAGGPSQMETFDYKPLLVRDDGQPMPIPKPRVQFAQTGNLLRPQWDFPQHGEVGRWIRDLFPPVAPHAAKVCVRDPMFTTHVVQAPACRPRPTAKL